MPTQYKAPTRFEMYQQAIEQLTEAVDALDQAHASMKDAGIQDIDSGFSPIFRGLDIRAVVHHAQKILDELKTAECDECGHALLKHGDAFTGCDHARDIEPCGCAWGQQRD